MKSVTLPSSLKPVEKYMKKNWVTLFLVLIVLVGAFLKLAFFSDLVRFNADQVRDAKVVEAMVHEQVFPLLGPRAGGTEFKLGPAFYYLEYLSASLFGNTPEGIALIFPLLSLASIMLFFLFFRLFFRPSFALGLTALYTTSFYFTKYSRFAWNPNAIPFFLIAFFYLLYHILDPQEKRAKQLLLWYGLLGLVIGIGSQLHTTLLLLMPALFATAHVWVSWQAKDYRSRLPAFFLTLALVFLAHLPMLIWDIQNDGANIRSFFQGTLTKTEENQSFATNILLNTQFFVQGTTYALSGLEPQKDWTRARTYESLPSTREIFLLVAGLGFFALGITRLILRYRHEKKSEKKRFLEICLAAMGFSFILFLPIAPELNLRFFIVLLFIPFLFLGILAEDVFHLLKEKKLFAVIVISAGFLIIGSLNLLVSSRTYNLAHYQAEDSAYGGLSLGEGRRLVAFIENAHATFGQSGNAITLYSFEFQRSLDYLLEKTGLTSQDIEEDQARLGLRYVITENAKAEAAWAKENCCYDVAKSERIGRFTIAALTPKVDPGACKIGFITDIHATYSKDNQHIGEGSYQPLLFFMDHMKNSFQPDILIENGDFIDGSETSNARALSTYQITDRLYQSLDIPAIHVMGNHETRGGGITTAQWLKQTGKEATYYKESCNNTEVIVLDGDNRAIRETMNDPSLETAYFITDEQFTWLESTLKQATEKQKVVFIHEPLFKRSEITSNIKPEKDMREADVERLQGLFKRYEVNAVFSGHVESLFQKTISGTAYYILPGVRKSENLPVRWLGSFAEIIVGSGGEIGTTFYYKKDTAGPYTSVSIPSQAFRDLEK